MMDVVVRPSEKVQQMLLAAVEKESKAEPAARKRRVAAMKAAAAAGVPITHIARSADLSREHVYRLIRD